MSLQDFERRKARQEAYSEGFADGVEAAIKALRNDILAFGAEHRGYAFAIRTLEALQTKDANSKDE